MLFGNTELNTRNEDCLWGAGTMDAEEWDRSWLY